MSDRLQINPPDDLLPKIVLSHPALPPWLARRLLRADEEVTWVRGPRWGPWWERYVTHPALMLPGLLLAAVCLWAGRREAGSWSELSPLLAVAAGVLVLGPLFVLGIAAGYFTRLVVTNYRIVIVQGYEVCRRWGLDNLPPSLVRFGKRQGKEASWSIDLNAVQTLFGDSSDQFAESKTILAFGKQLDRMKASDNHRPGTDQTQLDG
jgi:hypothetical protein